VHTYNIVVVALVDGAWKQCPRALSGLRPFTTSGEAWPRMAAWQSNDVVYELSLSGALA
jgi:hypothetical protein